MHGHLPFLISRLGMVTRHVSHLYHSAARLIEVGFYSLQIPYRKSDRLGRNGVVRPSADRHRSKAPVSSKPLLIHYHIFKNAGSSFHWAVQQAFGSQLRTCDASAADGILSPQELRAHLQCIPDVKGVLSHHAVLPPPKVRGRKVISSILIRDPIARVRSIYAFERQQAHSSPGAKKAKEMDFKAYVEWRLSCSPGMFCNYQVYFCTRTKASRHDETTTERHLQQAIENLDRIDIVGTVERYAEWLALAQSVLSRSFPKLLLAVARRNVTGASSDNGHAAILDHLSKELGGQLAERLVKCNYLDMCLHQVADALLTRRLAEEGVGIALLRAYDEASKNLSQGTTASSPTP